MTLRRQNIRTQVNQEALEAAKQIETQTSPDTLTQTETDMSAPTYPQSPTSTIASTDTISDTSSSPSTQPTSETETSTETYTYSEEELEALVKRNKRGKKIFEKTHERLTIWMLKSKKKKFKKLAEDIDVNMVDLMDEAVDDLFKKYRR